MRSLIACDKGGFMQETILSILGTILTALVTWISKEVIAWIKLKVKNAKAANYLSEAINIVTRAVKTINQTYVDNLKGENLFDKEAQQNALDKACEIAQEQLSSEAKEYLQNCFGDIDNWLKNTVESVIYDLKNQTLLLETTNCEEN